MSKRQLIARRLLRLKAAAEYMSLSTWKLRDVIHRGGIPIIQYGENAPWLLDVAELDQWIEAHKVNLDAKY
jgi:excisionase family DNA binding protein